MSLALLNGTAFDATEVILEIQFGEGGDDSKNFVEELYAAYERYVALNGLRIELLDASYGHRIAKVTGSGAGKAFQYENGKHCVQRIPDTETKGRKQTSIISVGVLPLMEKSAYQELKDKDLEVITQTGKQGAGGQNVNKVASAVRMKHLPTGLSVFINGRDQHKNRQEAYKILTAKVNEVTMEKINGDYASMRKAKMGNGKRSDKVRTYNFMESRVVDHRLGVKTSNVKGIMKGEFNLLFDKIGE